MDCKEVAWRNVDQVVITAGVEGRVSGGDKKKELLLVASLPALFLSE